MNEIIFMGFISALGAFILAMKISPYWFCKHHWQTDLVFAGLVTWMFFGTFSGMATAAVAGVMFSGLLFITKIVFQL